jgi:hypothetical protein
VTTMSIVDFSKELSAHDLQEVIAMHRDKLASGQLSDIALSHATALLDRLNYIDHLMAFSERTYGLAGYHAARFNDAMIKGDFAQANDHAQRIIAGQERFLEPPKYRRVA